MKVATSLLKNTGVMVDTALSGDECIAKVGGNKYDVIMLTANAVSGAREQFISEGFDDYLSKPFSLRKLQGMLMKYIPQEKSSKNNRNHFIGRYKYYAGF